MPEELLQIEQRLVFLTGVTGYVGGRLLRILEDKGVRIRCLSRHPEFVHPQRSETEVCRGDVLEPDSLPSAMAGVDTAYYLIHSMGTSGDFSENDRRGAENFARAARLAGVRRIVYLGGLASGNNLSPHLASRQEVGRILRESGVTTIEFRASIIIGSGSLSFELIRNLVNKLPVMITPKWVYSLSQPIAIEDVLDYLVEVLERDFISSQVFEIGGPEVVTYAQLMQEYAKQRGLRRWIVPVPVLTPWLSSLWLGLVTPVYARVGRKLIDSLKNSTQVRDHTALEVFTVRPRGIRESIERALANEDREFAETRWSDALSSRGGETGYGGKQIRSRIVDSRIVSVQAPPETVFLCVQRIGGQTGWYYGNWLWRLRGFLDLLVGGAGLRRGRPHPVAISVGNTIDFWRVEKFQPGQLLRLSAEMKLPGRAWLQFEVEPAISGSTLRQTAIFDPVGLAGLAYWYTLYPIHQLVFRGMLQNLSREAVSKAAEDRDDSLTRGWASTLVWVLLPFVAALIGSLFTMPSIPTWYAGLEKPPYTPPGWIFGPVWSVLYLMMGIAATIVWRHSRWDSPTHPLSFFVLQLILNTLWPILFFGLHLTGAALVEILVLLAFVAITTVAFFRVHWLASALMLPYLGWVSFATVLNWEIWRLN